MRSQRLEEIRKIFEIEPFVSLKDLNTRFPDVSEMTLRRDIETLEGAGEVIRVRGGARSVKFIPRTGVDSITKREGENVEGKRRIARCAAQYLEPGRSIFLDSGSTMRQLPAYVPEGRFSFTTTDPKLAVDLLLTGTSVVNMVGGRLERDNQTVTGLQATRFLNDVNVDIAYLTPTGISLENGFTVGSFNECELKKIVAGMLEQQRAAIDFVAGMKATAPDYRNLRARALVENETFIFAGLLLLRDAQKDSAREAIAERYIRDAKFDFLRNYELVMSGDCTTIARHEEVTAY